MRRFRKRLLVMPAAGAAVIGVIAFGHLGGSHPAAASLHPALAAAVNSAGAQSDTAPASDTDAVQSGSQTAPDTTAESASESAPETAAKSDGPGGFSDPAGANADTQQEGQH